MYNSFSPRRSRIFETEVGLAYHLFCKEVQYIMFFPKEIKCILFSNDVQYMICFPKEIKNLLFFTRGSSILSFLHVFSQMRSSASSFPRSSSI